MRAEDCGLDPYARGFLGKASSEKTSQATLLSNGAIQALYDEYLRTTKIGYDFDFREKVLREAMTAFGTKCFQNWMQLQMRQPGLTDMHMGFLNDTIQFIRTGRRSMNLENWQTLVVYKAGAPALGALSPEMRKYFRLDERYRGDTTMASIIRDWCSVPNGLEDLLGTLYILFCAPAVQ